jgi:hypothetical protein
VDTAISIQTNFPLSFIANLLPLFGTTNGSSIRSVDLFQVVYARHTEIAATMYVCRVVAVSNKEFRYGLQEDSGLKPPHLNVEELKGTSAAQWTLQRKGIQDQ